ncbi:MAG: helix-turn-helix domain-containing protein [Candidatus Korobacteraceae bacterium]
MGKAETNSQQRVQKEWLDLRALTQYASVSARTIREWIHRTNNPLPAAQVGNKLLISRTAFNDWLAGHTVQPSQSVTAIVEDVMQRIRS